MSLEEVLPQFLEEPGGHLVMNTDLRIVEVGPEFARLTRTRREDLLGESFLNIVTEPNRERHQAFIEEIRTATATVTKTKQTHKMPAMRLDILDPETRRSEERWWRPALTPIRSDGKVEYLVLRLEDVTTEERSLRLILAQRRANSLLYLLVLAVVTAVTWVGVTSFNRTNTLSKQNCQIQKQQIVGNGLLGHIMEDIRGIIIYSPKHQPHQVIPKKVLVYSHRLRKDLDRYLTVTEALPKHRRCK